MFESIFPCQGDVPLKKVDCLPKGAKKVNTSDKNYVLREGEATGHIHALEKDILVEPGKGDVYLDADNTIFLKIEKKAIITHNEHLHTVLNPGIWRVDKMREYNPFLEESRILAD